MNISMELQRLLAEVDAVLDPTKDMTPLERHIYECCTIETEMYRGRACDDPFDIVADMEESDIAYYGKNLNSL